MSKQLKATAILMLLAASCDNRCSDYVLKINQPMNLRELAVETETDETLWSFRASGQPLSQVRYGELPPGAVQMFPANRAAPRSFVPNERLVVRAYESEWFFFVRGFARQPRVFCGGFTEGGPLKSLKDHQPSFAGGSAGPAR
jgi:hypothetical protein